MVEKLEDQAEKDKEKVEQATKYNRKTGEDLGGGAKSGAYRKQTVDETLPKIIQSLVEKEREAREIIKSQDASRYNELPNLYNDIRLLEQKRDKVILQLKNPVDDNKDTKYVQDKYKAFLDGKPAHHDVKGKKDKYSFSSNGKAFTDDEIKYAMTGTATVPNLNKAGLSTKQQSRDRFGNALTITDLKQEEEDAEPKTKAEAEQAKKETPADRTKREEAEKVKMEQEGYEAYKKSKFDDKGKVTAYSTEYVAWTTKNKVDKDAYNKKYQAKYLKDDFVPENKPAAQSNLRGSGRRSGTRGRTSDTEGVSGEESTQANPQEQTPPKTSSKSEAEVGADGSSKTTDKNDEPTVKGKKTDADGDDKTEPEEYMTEEQKQEEADKEFKKTEVKEGDRPGTVPEFDILDASRDAPPIDAPTNLPKEPLTASKITSKRSDDVDKENKQRGKASIERLKEEIKAYHLVFDNNIKEFKDKSHKKQKNDALESDNIELVRKHHKAMETKIREYYRSGDADSLNVGVIIPIDTYLKEYLTKNTPQYSNIDPPTNSQTQGGGASHRHGHLQKKGHDPYGHAIAASTYYQRGGISSYKQKAVANHTLKIKAPVKNDNINDPKIYVDAPLNNYLQRPLKLTTNLKIKSKK